MAKGIKVEEGQGREETTQGQGQSTRVMFRCSDHNGDPTRELCCELGSRIFCLKDLGSRIITSRSLASFLNIIIYVFVFSGL